MFQILLKDQVTCSDFMSQDFQKTGRKQSFDIFSKKSLNESVTNFLTKVFEIMLYLNVNKV